MNNKIEMLEEMQKREIIPFKVGDTVKVQHKVTEGAKSRTQTFKGIVIQKKGAGIKSTFTVRKISFGVGVEKIFPLHSPKIKSIQVISRGKVRRSKLFYIREKVGKKARIKEKRRK